MPSRGRRNGFRGRLRFLLVGAHLADEPISNARYRFDVGVVIRFVFQRSAEQRNVLRQVVVFHVRVGPQLLNQFVLGDEMPGTADQQRKRVEGFWGERDDFSAATQQALPNVEAIRPKLEGPHARFSDLDPWMLAEAQ
jgi:hypothetical protein